MCSDRNSPGLIVKITAGKLPLRPQGSCKEVAASLKVNAPGFPMARRCTYGIEAIPEARRPRPQPGSWLLAEETRSAAAARGVMLMKARLLGPASRTTRAQTGCCQQEAPASAALCSPRSTSASSGHGARVVAAVALQRTPVRASASRVTRGGRAPSFQHIKWRAHCLGRLCSTSAQERVLRRRGCSLRTDR